MGNKTNFWFINIFQEEIIYYCSYSVMWSDVWKAKGPSFHQQLVCSKSSNFLRVHLFIAFDCFIYSPFEAIHQTIWSKINYTEILIHRECFIDGLFSLCYSLTLTPLIRSKIKKEEERERHMRGILTGG